MERPSAIRQYFDAKAASYDRGSRRGLWARVRERERRALLDLLGPLAGLDVLELGCGSGYYSECVREGGGNPFGVDSSPPMMVKFLCKGLQGTCADAISLQLGRKFPLILAAGLLEFLEDDAPFFRSVHSHALPAARLVLLVPRGGGIGRLYDFWHLWAGCPSRVRGVDEVAATAARAGWALEEIRDAGPLAFALRFSCAGGGDA